MRHFDRRYQRFLVLQIVKAEFDGLNNRSWYDSRKQSKSMQRN
jgi:hypothetical protein